MTMARGAGAVFTSSTRRRPTAWRIAGSPSFADPDLARVPKSREDRPMTGLLLRRLRPPLASWPLAPARSPPPPPPPVKPTPETALHRTHRTPATPDPQPKTPGAEAQA